MRPEELPQIVDECWNHLPAPPERYAAKIAQYCRFRSKGKEVLVELFELMVSEHKAYLMNIPKYELAEDISTAMAIDFREQMAWHLAANRAEARLLLAPVPKTLNGHAEESWMILNTPK